MIVKGLANWPISHEKPFQLTLTGVKKVKEHGPGRCFKSQYWTAPGISARADGWLLTKKESDNLDIQERAGRTPKSTPKSTPKKNRVPEEIFPGMPPEILAATCREKKGFKFNKKEIRHRVLAVFNFMRHAPQIARHGIKPCMHFFTVTFKAGTPDRACYDLLNIWLTQLRQQGKLKSYLWIAERQKNKTIHFHLLVPHYMRAQSANAIMRKSILGYIKKKKITHWPAAEARKYNGVDIAKNRKTKRVVNFAEKKSEKSLHRYITKYVSKNDEVYDSQPWRCSRDWSALVKGVNVPRDFAAAVLGGTSELIDLKSFENEYIEFWRWKSEPPDKLCLHLAQINYEMLRAHFASGEHYFYNLN